MSTYLSIPTLTQFTYIFVDLSSFLAMLISLIFLYGTKYQTDLLSVISIVISDPQKIRKGLGWGPVHIAQQCGGRRNILDRGN